MCCPSFKGFILNSFFYVFFLYFYVSHTYDKLNKLFSSPQNLDMQQFSAHYLMRMLLMKDYANDLSRQLKCKEFLQVFQDF